MPHHAGEHVPLEYEVPEDDQETKLTSPNEFVLEDNILVATSRLYREGRGGSLVYIGDHVGMRFGLVAIDSPDDAPYSYNPRRDRFGNNEIAFLDVVKDSERW